MLRKMLEYIKKLLLTFKTDLLVCLVLLIQLLLVKVNVILNLDSVFF